MGFIVPVAALAKNENGGMPKEIVEMFERYKAHYNFYGNKGDNFISKSGKQEKIKQPYNLSFAFALFDSESPKALNAIYESVKAGISEWNDGNVEYTNGFMNNRSDYMKHLKLVYADSKYLVDADFELTAEALYASYKNNEVAADEMYKGKKIAVTAEISDIW